VQEPVPLQTPVLPQGGLAGQPESTVPAGTAAHAPALAPTLHAWQVGHAPTPQQTSSVQKPEAHSLAPVQDWPPPFLGKQLPPAPVQ